jgi:hypothetical protein
MRGLSNQSAAVPGQKVMLFESDGTPIGKMQAPVDQSATPLVFDENSQATPTTEPSVTASADTMGKIYLVGPKSGTKYQWITLEDDSTTTSVYSWLQIGSTQIDLSTYEAPESEVRAIVTNWEPDE